MPTVDLIYDPECPNISAARTNLMRAFSRAGVAARWQEHRIGDDEAPPRVRGFGSPTLLVDGRDVADEERGSESCCRVYGGDAARAPSVEAIAAALASAPRAGEPAPSDPAMARPRWGRTRSGLPALSALGVALMPKVVCPLCWPAYAGALSATGLTFLMEDEWLLPISATLLLAALAALTWRARTRRGHGPALSGLAGSLAILAGKFALESDVTVYAGVTALVAASIWNSWPRPARAATCGACVPKTQS